MLVTTLPPGCAYNGTDAAGDPMFECWTIAPPTPWEVLSPWLPAVAFVAALLAFTVPAIVCLARVPHGDRRRVLRCAPSLAPAAFAVGMSWGTTATVASPLLVGLMASAVDAIPASSSALPVAVAWLSGTASIFILATAGFASYAFIAGAADVLNQRPGCDLIRDPGKHPSPALADTTTACPETPASHTTPAFEEVDR